jgi:hypothetical protein
VMKDLKDISEVINSGLTHIIRFLADCIEPCRRYFASDDDQVHTRLSMRRRRMGLTMSLVLISGPKIARTVDYQG